MTREELRKGAKKLLDKIAETPGAVREESIRANGAHSDLVYRMDENGLRHTAAFTEGRRNITFSVNRDDTGERRQSGFRIAYRVDEYRIHQTEVYAWGHRYTREDAEEAKDLIQRYGEGEES